MSTAEKIYFDVNTIYENYLKVQADFRNINQRINCQRDDFDYKVIKNLMLAQNFLNETIAHEGAKKFLAPSDMLELNAIIHLGRELKDRTEFQGFLELSREKFDKHLPYLMKWCKRHERDNDDPYLIAAGLYVRILAAPQLFSDGNHRTGAMVANYYLLRKGLNPFVLTNENAEEFFNLASDVKFKKKDIKSRFKRAVGWGDEIQTMRKFLKNNAQPFTVSKPCEWKDRLVEQRNPQAQDLQL
jgi:prophage maintenance system killer protein